MTQIRRLKGGGTNTMQSHQKRTLVCVAVAVLGTMSLVVLFLQIDSWPTKHYNHARMIKPPGLTPGVVGTALLESITTKQQRQQQQQQQNLRRSREQNERRPIPNESAALQGGEEEEQDEGVDEEEEDYEANPEEEQQASGDAKNSGGQEQQGAQQQQQQDRTFVMELENLKPDAATGSTSGVVVFETRAAWAPIGVAHFHDLVDAHFYDAGRFFRVVDNFVVQFGIAADPQVQAQWKGTVLKDDAVLTTNAMGTLTYATSGKDTRTTQLFINTNKKGNKFLDGQGFAPFALITKGLEHVNRINNEYGEKPDQGKIQNRGNEYLQQEFPHLSYVNVIRPATSLD